ncbi:MAG: CinA family protein, partial [Thiomargarita sp.]|nr:CinA family protein [Thiomargarita sp.]
MTELEQYANSLGQLLREKAWRLVTAESCTGGWIAQTVTSVNGSSDWFDCGFVSYSNTSKQALLGVKTETLEQYGAVSKPVVLEMVQGAISQSQTQVGIAISGIAGPGGGTEDKPVG